MKKWAMAIALAALGSAALADPVEGIWKTQPGDNGRYGLVDIRMCGSEVCGILGQGYDSAGKKVESPNIGRKMIWGMRPQGDGTYKGGKIWAPDRDKTYNSNMTLKGNKLEVKGCVLMFCRGQVWTRVK